LIKITQATSQRNIAPGIAQRAAMAAATQSTSAPSRNTARSFDALLSLDVPRDLNSELRRSGAPPSMPQTQPQPPQQQVNQAGAFDTTENESGQRANAVSAVASLLSMTTQDSVKNASGDINMQIIGGDDRDKSASDDDNSSNHDTSILNNATKTMSTHILTQTQ